MVCKFDRYANILGLILALCGVSTVQGHTEPEIALDVGHGLIDGGARSARGRSEFAFNLEFAQVLATTLTQRGFGVRPVNFSGEIRELAERPRVASGSTFFISLHHDSISESYLEPWDWDGLEEHYTRVKYGHGLFVSADNPHPARSQACALAMGEALRTAGFVPTPWHGRKHRPLDASRGVWFYDRLVVLYRTTLPAVLFEAGVIKHREEELALRDPLRQQKMAEALVTGLQQCLNFPGKSAPE